MSNGVIGIFIQSLSTARDKIESISMEQLSGIMELSQS